MQTERIRSKSPVSLPLSPHDLRLSAPNLALLVPFERELLDEPPTAFQNRPIARLTNPTPGKHEISSQFPVLGTCLNRKISHANRERRSHNLVTERLTLTKPLPASLIIHTGQSYS